MLPIVGCCRKKVEVPGESRIERAREAANRPKTGKDGEQVSEKPLPMLENTGLNYSIDGSGRKIGKESAMKAGSNFEKDYLVGVELMEKGEFPQAINIFDELIKRYPNSEEASIAELCIAELLFRTKANDRALAAYERIVEKYPNSHAAENARAGIEYLKNISRYEEEYVSPDVEGKKRRGY